MNKASDKDLTMTEIRFALENAAEAHDAACMGVSEAEAEREEAAHRVVEAINALDAADDEYAKAVAEEGKAEAKANAAWKRYRKAMRELAHCTALKRRATP